MFLKFPLALWGGESFKIIIERVEAPGSLGRVLSVSTFVERFGTLKLLAFFLLKIGRRRTPLGCGGDGGGNGVCLGIRVAGAFCAGGATVSSSAARTLALSPPLLSRAPVGAGVFQVRRNFTTAVGA